MPQNIHLIFPPTEFSRKKKIYINYKHDNIESVPKKYSWNDVSNTSLH